MSRRLVARPRPVPRGFVVMNGRKIVSARSAGTPGPWSRTLHAACPSRAPADRTILASGDAFGRLERVDEQVDDHLPHHVGVGQHVQGPGPAEHLQAGALGGRARPGEHDGVVEQPAQVGLREHRRLGSCEIEQLADDAIHAREFLRHVAENAPGLLRFLLPGEHVDGGLRAGQGVADLVGEAGRHLAKRGELLHAGHLAALRLLLDLPRPAQPGDHVVESGDEAVELGGARRIRGHFQVAVLNLAHALGQAPNRPHDDEAENQCDADGDERELQRSSPLPPSRPRSSSPRSGARG